MPVTIYAEGGVRTTTKPVTLMATRPVTVPVTVPVTRTVEAVKVFLHTLVITISTVYATKPVTKYITRYETIPVTRYVAAETRVITRMAQQVGSAPESPAPSQHRSSVAKVIAVEVGKPIVTRKPPSEAPLPRRWVKLRAG